MALTTGALALNFTPGTPASIANAGPVLQGTPPTPRQKPPAPPSVGLAGGMDIKSIDAARSAFAAAARGDWVSAKAAQNQAVDPGAKKLIAWRITADRGRNPSFSEIDDALSTLAGYPRITDLRTRAEEQIEFAGLTPAARVAWLQKNGGPVSSSGRAALARALIDSGRIDEGKVALQTVWREENLTPDQERRTLASYGKYLTSADHAARIDLLLWLRDNSAAQALMPYVDSGTQDLAKARMALRARAKKVDALVAALPQQYQDHAGLLFDRAQWRRTARGAEDPCLLLALIDGAQVPSIARGRLWDDLRPCAAKEVKVGNFAKAYAIVSRHGMKSGQDFADAEFLSGFFALRKLNDLAKADKHFASLESGVRTPVSKARAIYWRALTAQTRNDKQAAATFFGLAAQYPTTFYGQLASLRHAPGAPLNLPASEPVTDADRAVFEGRDLTKAVRILTALNEDTLFEEFILRLDDQLSSPAEHVLLSEIAQARLEPKLALRSAKVGMQRGVVAMNAAYPLMPIPSAARSVIEPAFTLAITRQESEFDPYAVSSAGARGLMQLMPATARAVSQQIGRPFNLGALTKDPNYNIELGSTYLSSMVDNWGGSYILAIVSYNAGPGRARQWIDAYGDPRSPSVDPLDWMETIPIEETRNYVQRVLENLQIYRSRLAPAAVPLGLEQDLKRGRIN